MADTYEVKITTQAQTQLQEILHYIARELKAPEAARNLLNILRNAVASLSQFPNRVPLPQEEPWRSNNIHKMPVKNFFIYFWVNENQCKVLITAIVYSKRHQIRQLR